jgi:hypothetical protein
MKIALLAAKALQMVRHGLISRILHTLQGSRWNSVIAMTGSTIHLYVNCPFVWFPPFPATPLIVRTRRPPDAPASHACRAASGLDYQIRAQQEEPR